MSTPAEDIERLRIRLVGDSSHYMKELAKVEAATKSFAANMTTNMNANNFVNPTITGGTVQDTWAKQDAQRAADMAKSTANTSRDLQARYEQRQKLAEEYGRKAEAEAKSAGQRSARAAAEALANGGKAEANVGKANAARKADEARQGAKSTANTAKDMQSSYNERQKLAEEYNRRSEVEAKSAGERSARAAADALAKGAQVEKNVGKARLAQTAEEARQGAEYAKQRADAHFGGQERQQKAMGEDFMNRRKREADARAEMDSATADSKKRAEKVAAEYQKGVEYNRTLANNSAKLAYQDAEKREADARKQMDSAAAANQRRAEKMAAQVGKMEKEAADKQEKGREYNRTLAANSAKMEQQEAAKWEKSNARANAEAAKKAQQDEVRAYQSVGKALHDVKDKRARDDQARFEASNRAALARDREAERERLRIAKHENEQLNIVLDRQKEDRKRAAQASSQFGNQVQQAVKGTAVVLGSTAAALGYFGSTAVDEYGKFNQAYTESISIMRATSEEEKKVEQAALDMSKVSKYGPAELAKAFYYLASAGMTAEQSIAALPVVSNFATAGAVDLQKATSLLMTSQAAMGMKADDATENMQNLTRVTDVLTKASVLSEGTVTDFAFALTREAGASARAFGKDIEEVTALIMNFSRQGIKGEVAGSYTARLTRFLADRSVENQKVFKQLGVNVFDEQTGKMRAYADILEDMGKAFSDLSQEGRTAVLHLMGFEPRMQSAVMAALGGSKQMRKDITSLRQASKEGFTAGVAEKQMTSFLNQMKMVQNQVTAATIKIGELLAPALLIAAKAVSLFVSAWEALPDSLKNAVVWGTALFALMAGGFAAAVAAVIAFNFLFGNVPLLILAGIAAVTLFVAGLAAIGGLVFEQMGGWKKLKAVFNDTLDAFAPAIDAAKSLWNTFLNVVTKGVTNLTTYITDTVSGWFGNIDWNEVVDKATSVFNFMEFTLLKFGVVWDYTWKAIKYYTIVALNFILNHVFDIMTLGIRPIIKLFSDNWRTTMTNLDENTQGGFSSMLLSASKFMLKWGLILAGQGHLVPDFNVGELFKGVEVDLAGIKIKGLDDLENRLKDDMDKAAKKMKEGFDEFQKQQPIEIPLFEEDVNKFVEKGKAEEKGKEGGKQYMKGLDSGIKAGTSSIVGSAEALSRILAYRDVAREPGESFKVHGGKKVEAVNAGAGFNGKLDEQINLLKRIAENGDNVLKKEPLKLEGAGF